MLRTNCFGKHACVLLRTVWDFVNSLIMAEHKLCIPKYHCCLFLTHWSSGTSELLSKTNKRHTSACIIIHQHATSCDILQRLAAVCSDMQWHTAPCKGMYQHVAASSVHKSGAKSTFVQVSVQPKFSFRGHSCRNGLAAQWFDCFSKDFPPTLGLRYRPFRIRRS